MLEVYKNEKFILILMNDSYRIFLSSFIIILSFINISYSFIDLLFLTLLLIKTGVFRVLEIFWLSSRRNDFGHSVEETH